MTMLASRGIRPTNPELVMSMRDDTHAAWLRALLGSGVLACVLFAGAPAALEAQRPDPLGELVAEALRTNLGLEGERLAERRADADVREARGLFFPSLVLDSRYSHFDGVPNVGDLVNPAYTALNQLTGTNRFPTNIDLTLPQRHESRVRFSQPLFNEGIRANYSLARGRQDGQRMARAAAAGQLAADVQIACLQEASARRVAEIYDATAALVQENQRVAERLLDAGRATPEAVYRARAERADVEQQLAEARERHLAAARALNRILRRPLDAPIAVIPDGALALPLDITPDSTVAHALAVREELGQAAAATADARLEAARRTFALVRRRYDEGIASPIEFVDARTAYTSAELNRVLTAYRYAMRWVDLERAAALRTLAL